MIIADNGPLIILARLELLKILQQLFKKICLPEQVYNECTANMRLPGALAIKESITAGILELKYVAELNPVFSDAYLGEGERAAMSLALAENTPILLDDKRARLAAERQNLQVVGTAGILLAAKQRQLIKEIKIFIQQMEEFEYYISNELKINLLKRAKED